MHYTYSYPHPEEVYYDNEYKMVMPFSSGSYIEVFNDENVWLLTKIHEGIFLTTDNCIIIATHGDKDGNILHYEKILEIINNPEFNKYPIYIHCCYQKSVAKKYPKLKKHLFMPDCDLYTGMGAVISFCDADVSLGRFVLYKDFLKCLSEEE